VKRPRHFRRGVAILPSLFTTGNLFLGFWAIVKTLDGEFAEAAPLIGGAVVLDMLDGRIARLTGTQSAFGAELDSLADTVSFGVAPALLAYGWALNLVPRAGWLAAFLFLVCGVLRLARFNIQKNVVDSRFFVGLPIPAAAAHVAAIVLFVPEPSSLRLASALMLALVVTLALLMVATFRYHSFKGFDLRRRRRSISVLGIAVVFLLVALDPKIFLLVATSLYTLSGPGLYVLGLVRRRESSEPEPAAATEEPQAAP